MLLHHAAWVTEARCVAAIITSCRSSSSLLSIVSDDDISVGFRPLHALLVGERIDQFTP